MLSYAQNHEDVLLNRIFADQQTGFYIDVGAWLPVLDSVTKHFYEHGWHGINVEPVAGCIARLRAERPRDINLEVGLSNHEGTMTLYETPVDSGGSTFTASAVDELRRMGIDVVESTVAVTTLARVCEQYVSDPIDFLKIDVEGHERQVLEGADWSRWRPRVLVIEATVPMSAAPNHHEWEHLVLDAGYLFATFDGLNRFYVRQEEADLADLLRTPVNIIDDYTPLTHAVEVARLEDDLRRTRAELDAARRELQKCRSLGSIPLPNTSDGDENSMNKLIPELISRVTGRNRKLATWLRRLSRPTPRTERIAGLPTVLVLTPIKDAADCLDRYCELLFHMTYPHHSISLGFLESDSTDTTFRDIERRLPRLRTEFRRVSLWKKDFGYRVPAGLPRWAPSMQVERRSVMAKSRNHLLFHALDDEEWVLWLDADVTEYPPDLIERLLAAGKDILQPHCVLDPGGPTFDRNGWRDHGRLHLDDLRDEGDLVELDAVGATVLLVRADLHREGLIYPTFLYGRANPLIRVGHRQDLAGQPDGEIETEGLGIMARDMGYRCWGMPHFEVIHRRK